MSEFDGGTGNEFRSDRPCSDLREVLDGRVKFDLGAHALNLSRLIMNVRPFDGQIIAVNAPWGSGKTSLVNLTKELLKGDLPKVDGQKVELATWAEAFAPAPDQVAPAEDALKQIQGTDRLVVKLIDVWTQPRDVDLTFVFLDAIEEAYRDDDGFSKFLSRRKNELMRDVSAIESVVPLGLGQLASKILGATQTPRSFRESLTEQLEKAGTKKNLLFIVDDMDRLTPDQISRLVAAIWWVRDLPRVMLLLLYDQKVVIEAIAQVHFPGTFLNEDQIERTQVRNSATQYLEKIVQYNYDFPDPSERELLNFVLARAEEMTGKQIRNGSRFGEHGRHAISRRILGQYIKNPRTMKRMVSGISISDKLLTGSNYDLNDFLVVVALKLFGGPEYDELKEMVRMLEAGNLDQMELNTGELDWRKFLFPANVTCGESVMESLTGDSSGKKKCSCYIESIEELRDRSGFGDPLMARSYLQGFLTHTRYFSQLVEEFFDIDGDENSPEFREFKRKHARAIAEPRFAAVVRMRSKERYDEDQQLIFERQLEVLRDSQH